MLHQGVLGHTEMYRVERRGNHMFGHNIRLMYVENKNDHRRRLLIKGQDKIYVNNHDSIQTGMETRLRSGHMRNWGSIHTRRRKCTLI
jgi:hypothetical protein